MPAWEAVSTHDPEDTSVSVVPETEQVDVSPEVTVAVRPDDAENDKVMVFAE